MIVDLRVHRHDPRRKADDLADAVELRVGLAIFDRRGFLAAGLSVASWKWPYRYGVVAQPTSASNPSTPQARGDRRRMSDFVARVRTKATAKIGRLMGTTAGRRDRRERDTYQEPRGGTRARAARNIAACRIVISRPPARSPVRVLAMMARGGARQMPRARCTAVSASPTYS